MEDHLLAIIQVFLITKGMHLPPSQNHSSAHHMAYTAYAAPTNGLNDSPTQQFYQDVSGYPYYHPQYNDPAMWVNQDSTRVDTEGYEYQYPEINSTGLVGEEIVIETGAVEEIIPQGLVEVEENDLIDQTRVVFDDELQKSENKRASKRVKKE